MYLLIVSNKLKIIAITLYKIIIPGYSLNIGHNDLLAVHNKTVLRDLIRWIKSRVLQHVLNK